MKPLPQQYDHLVVEKKWQEEWERRGVYHWDESETRANSFVIDTPPPTVSGLLHMGHIFSYTQADFVARYQRMKGKTVFYPMGFDDNGLPTERLVEKVKKKRASDYATREEFVGVCQEVVREAEAEFRALFRAVALSVDWRQEYQTISAESRTISQMSFLDLFHKQEAYRKEQPMFWDPIDQTAIAQAEIEDKELPSHMNYIRFGVEDTHPRVTPPHPSPLPEGDGILIATTRPELLAACVAVFFHPDDARYQHLRGKTAVTPLFGARVPLLADEDVKMEKGTGLVMCCTFGDEMDIQWWRRHQLPLKVVLDKYGKVRLDGAAYSDVLEGLKVTAAREKILEILREQNLLVKQDAITHAVKCAERSGAPLEILSTSQWFVRVLPHKDALKEKARECEWHPEYMRVRMEQWIDGLSWDWCISRQRYFGVPFPVWYSKRAGEEGKILVADLDQLPVDPLVDLPRGYVREEVEADRDVMDTWATSSVSPQLSSKGINLGSSRTLPHPQPFSRGEKGAFIVDGARHAKLFPADLRPQAHEIIRTWAFYTMVKAYLHEGVIPWKHLMISGWCLAADKTKMSKSKGNVVTPVALIEEKGADVVRYWASTSRLGADTAYSEDVFAIGKKLVTKLWNATKFAAIHLDKLSNTPKSAREEMESGVICETLDRWILSRLAYAIDVATREFERFEYCDARVAAEEFFWKEFCDNYLEMVKVRVYGEQRDADPRGQKSAVHTLAHCLDGILRLFAPFVPHITEELYTHIFDGKGDLLQRRGAWPDVAAYARDVEAEKSGEAAVRVLETVRKEKAERKVSIKTPFAQLCISESDRALFTDSTLFDLKHVTHAEATGFDSSVPAGEVALVFSV